MVQENITVKATETTEENILLEGKELDRAIAAFMRKCGIPAHLLGYDYLVEAIKLSYKDKSYVHFVTKRLYPKLAKEYKATASRVERAMRHAIELAFERGNNEFLEANFAYDATRGKSTNSEFIADAVVYLKNNY